MKKTSILFSFILKCIFIEFFAMMILSLVVTIKTINLQTFGILASLLELMLIVSVVIALKIWKKAKNNP